MILKTPMILRTLMIEKTLMILKTQTILTRPMIPKTEAYFCEMIVATTNFTSAS